MFFECHLHSYKLSAVINLLRAIVSHSFLTAQGLDLGNFSRRRMVSRICSASQTVKYLRAFWSFWKFWCSVVFMLSGLASVYSGTLVSSICIYIAFPVAVSVGKWYPSMIVCCIFSLCATVAGCMCQTNSNSISAFYKVEGYTVIAAFTVLAIMFFSLLIGNISADEDDELKSLPIFLNFVYGKWRYFIFFYLLSVLQMLPLYRILPIAHFKDSKKRIIVFHAMYTTVVYLWH